MDTIKNQLKHLPTSPGIYQMLNVQGEIIYIGKAKDLKRRVRSYFTKTHTDIKTQIMVKYIVDFNIITTHTEKEALILENQLIKTYKPRYNILLKDDKTYPYIKLTTTEPFPKIVITRTKKNDKCTYFGPYPSIGSTRKLRRLLYELFPIRDCKQDITLTETQPKCLLLDIQKCIGPCVYKDIKSDYDQLVQKLIAFLNGKEKHIARDFRKKMMHYSATQDYEKASIYRDKLFRIEQLLTQQRVQIELQDHTQIWAVAENDQFFYLTIQEIVKGQLLYQHGFFEAKNQFDFNSFIDVSVVHLIDKLNKFPESIICDDTLGHYLQTSLNLTESVIHIPKIGEKKQLLKNAQKNSLYALDRLVLQTLKDSQTSAVTALKEGLNLQQQPDWILGFDISHLQAQHIVASSVSFRSGKPCKEEYRRYNIKTVSRTSHDPQSIYEVVYRRLSRCKDEGNVPNLLLIDGGKGQLNFAMKALYQLDLDKKVEIVALAKRLEECFLPHQKDSIILEKHHSGLQLLQQVRDEAHRFAVTFQRQKRLTSTFLSKFMAIEGVGVKRFNKLMTVYPDLNQLKEDDIETIATKTLLPKHIIMKILDSI